jgi:hypothetical protein
MLLLTSLLLLTTVLLLTSLLLLKFVERPRSFYGPGPGQFQLTTSRNWPDPGKSSYVVLKSRKMTYRGLANSGL